MNRRNFLAVAGAAAAAAVAPKALRAESPSPSLRLANDRFELSLHLQDGMACRLVHVPSGTLLASGPYCYSVGSPVWTQVQQEDHQITLVGRTAGGLEIAHCLRLPKDTGWLEEELSLRNVGATVWRGEPRFGFCLPASPQRLHGFTFTAVPFRREPSGNRSQYADYSFSDILERPRVSNLRGNMRWGEYFTEGIHQRGTSVDEKHPLTFPVYASEGWAIGNGQWGFLLTKYNPRAMEWAILDCWRTGTGAAAVRWGGAGIYSGDPEDPCELAPGATFRFGVTRLTPYSGDLTEGFYAFRREMEGRGHGVPRGFDPPLHWNELYDNRLWWLPNDQFNDPEKRQEFYRRSDLEEAAAKAQAMGCEALYLDPGWDVSFASKIWDTARLGPMDDFVRQLAERHRLKLSLHTPLSGWCDPTSYSFACCRLDPTGKRDRLSLCGASHQYVDETVRRLARLGREGATFFMFDGSAFNGPCWDRQHGHPVPSRRHDHVAATNQIAFRVHEQFPAIQIEMHDQVLGPVPARYVPIYLGYGSDASGRSSARGFDTIWAFELMWDPMRNLSEGNSVCLYYYNLAYSQPLYLHIDLRTDNAEAVMFWWNASTCRHLGIGGTHPNPAIREAQRQAVATYRRLKPHFTSGTFYGLDESVHVHRHPTTPTAVINCFNLDPAPAVRKIRLHPERCGLPPDRRYRFVGGAFRSAGEFYEADLPIPAMGHRLVEVIPA